MQFLTQILGRTVFDSAGEPVGKVRDVIATPTDQLPIISAVVLGNGRQELIVPWERIREEVGQLSLPGRKDRIVQYTPREDDIWLKRSVLDRQIVDVHDYKVVRVNDVRFIETQGKTYLLGVDASTRGLLRELGIDWLAGVLRYMVGKPLPEKIIAWNDVETLEQVKGSIKLKVPFSEAVQVASF